MPGAFGGVQEQSRPPLFIGREPGGPLKRACRGGISAARAAPSARLLERGRGRLVDSDGGGREVPGTPVDVSVGQGLGKRPMGLASLPSGRVGIDRRARERVAELDRPGPHGDQAGGLGRGQDRQVDPQPGGRALEHRHIAALAGRREHQGAAGRRIEFLDPAQEGARDSRRNDDGRARGSELELVRIAGQLDQSQGVAGGGAVQPLRGSGGQPMEERRGVLGAQSANPTGGDVGAVEQRRIPLADGDQHRDRIGHQTPEGEQQRLGARIVEPVSIVDEHGDRGLLGVRRQQAERRRTHREALLGQPGTQRQGSLERHRLRPGNPIERDQGRAQQLEQRRERDLRFGLDPPRSQDPHAGAGGSIGGIVEQHGLADARLAHQRERCARARPRLPEDAVYLLALALTPQQHRAGPPLLPCRTIRHRLGAPRMRTTRPPT